MMGSSLDKMTAILGRFVNAPSDLAFAAVVITAASWMARYQRRRGLLERAVDKLHLPWPLRVKVENVLAPEGAPRGCFLALLFGMLAVLTRVLTTGGALGALVVAFGAFAFGGAVGALIGRRRGVVNSLLVDLARRAQAAADQLSAGGTDEEREAYRAFVSCITTLCRHVPNLSLAMLEGYDTPREIAALLEDGDEYELGAWLARSSRPLWTAPEEQARVAFLERVRSEIIKGGGRYFRDIERRRQLIEELDRWSPGA